MESAKKEMYTCNSRALNVHLTRCGSPGRQREMDKNKNKSKCYVALIILIPLHMVIHVILTIPL